MHTDQFGVIAGAELELGGAYGDVREGRLFGPQGGVSGHEAMRDFTGTGFRNKPTLARRTQIREATKLYADCVQGRVEPFFLKQAMSPTHGVFVEWLRENYPGLYARDSHNGSLLGLRETMATSDYQALYVDVLDRLYYGTYNDYPIVNKPMVRMHSLRDFRLVSRYLLDGMVTPMTAIDPAAPPLQTAMSGPVPQDGATFPTTNTAPLQYAPLLYQAMASVNWSAFVNDDLGIFRDVAVRLAIQANRAIAKFITSFFVDANGPNALLYTTAYRNKINTTNGAASNNPPLGVQGIVDALKVLALQRDSSGQPIMITGRMFCFYGPSNYATAMNLKNQLSVFLSNEGGGANSEGFPTQFLQVNNWAIQNMEFIMDPYMPIVMSGASGNIAQTAWGIVVDPQSQNRPAVEVGMLTGYETPQMFQKVPNTMRMGGGVDQMMGDFNSMNQDTKIVTVMGGSQIDGRSTVASTGAGS
jgi:hypothetical protein